MMDMNSMGGESGGGEEEACCPMCGGSGSVPPEVAAQAQQSAPAEKPATSEVVQRLSEAMSKGKGGMRGGHGGM